MLKILFLIKKKNMNQYNILDVEMNEDLLKNVEYCIICYEDKNKVIVCKKCKYEMCKDCYQKYIKDYKYTNCPHCRETIIEEMQMDVDDSYQQLPRNKLFFKILFGIALLVETVFLGAYINKDKETKSLTVDLFIGFLFVSIVFICIGKYL